MIGLLCLDEYIKVLVKIHPAGTTTTTGFHHDMTFQHGENFVRTYR